MRLTAAQCTVGRRAKEFAQESPAPKAKHIHRCERADPNLIAEMGEVHLDDVHLDEAHLDEAHLDEAHLDSADPLSLGRSWVSLSAFLERQF